jgi:hypothetical protein
MLRNDVYLDRTKFNDFSKLIQMWELVFRIGGGLRGIYWVRYCVRRPLQPRLRVHTHTATPSKERFSKKIYNNARPHTKT